MLIHISESGDQNNKYTAHLEQINRLWVRRILSFSLEGSDSHDIFLSSNSTDKMKLAVLASVIVGAAAFAPNSVSK